MCVHRIGLREAGADCHRVFVAGVGHGAVEVEVERRRQHLGGVGIDQVADGSAVGLERRRDVGSVAGRKGRVARKCGGVVLTEAPTQNYTQTTYMGGV